MEILAAIPPEPGKGAASGARTGAAAGLVVRLVGELDLSNATVVQDQLVDLLSYCPTADVVLDLSGVSFMDCSGLRVLLELRRVLTVGRRHLSLCRARPCVEMLLRVSRDEDLLDVPPRRPDEAGTGRVRQPVP